MTRLREKLWFTGRSRHLPEQEAIPAERVRAGTLTAEVLLEGIIRTAREGGRLEYDDAGLRLYNSAGDLIVEFDVENEIATIIGTLQTNFPGNTPRLEISNIVETDEFDRTTIAAYLATALNPGVLSFFAEVGIGDNSVSLLPPRDAAGDAPRIQLKENNISGRNSIFLLAGPEGGGGSGHGVYFNTHDLWLRAGYQANGNIAIQIPGTSITNLSPWGTTGNFAGMRLVNVPSSITIFGPSAGADNNVFDVTANRISVRGFLARFTPDSTTGGSMQSNRHFVTVGN